MGITKNITDETLNSVSVLHIGYDTEPDDFIKNSRVSHPRIYSRSAFMSYISDNNCGDTIEQEPPQLTRLGFEYLGDLIFSKLQF